MLYYFRNLFISYIKNIKKTEATKFDAKNFNKFKKIILLSKKLSDEKIQTFTLCIYQNIKDIKLANIQNKEKIIQFLVEEDIQYLDIDEILFNKQNFEKYFSIGQ